MKSKSGRSFCRISGNSRESILCARVGIRFRFLPSDIRYVAISLGIGGWQPHPAADVFLHRYGDCKDKASLMHAMLREIGVDSYLVLINTERGSVTRDSPAHNGFNHVVLAIKL